MKIIYEAIDGMQFNSEEECKNHENKMSPNWIKDLKLLVPKMKDYCIERCIEDTNRCDNCPLYNICSEYVDDWEL